MEAQTLDVRTRDQAYQRGLALIYIAAGVSVVASLALWAMNFRDAASFVAIWVPSILSLVGALSGRSSLVPLAGMSMLLSIALWFLVDKQAGLFVGVWVPSILSFAATQRR